MIRYSTDPKDHGKQCYSLETHHITTTYNMSDLTHCETIILIIDESEDDRA
jgi:hypothetical protein